MEAICYFIFVHLSLLALGFSLVSTIGVFKNNRGIHISLGYLLSIVFIGTLALSYYVLHLPLGVIQVIFWVALLVATFIFWKKKLYISIQEIWLPLSAFVLMSALGLCFISFNLSSSQHIVPDPEPRADRNYTTLSTKILNLAHTQANDNYIPYRQAQFFVNRSNPATDSFINEWGVHFFQRTPLMGAATAGYFLAFNDRPPVDYTWSSSATDPNNTYVKFQIIAQILNSIFIVPAFFLIRKLFNVTISTITTIFLIPSQFFVYDSFFSWPKSFVAFFIIFSWLLLLTSQRSRYTVLAAAASGLAYLAHDLAVLYVGSTVVFLLFSHRFKDVFIIAAGSAVFALPWLFTASVLFKKPSSFIYYPISTKDIPQPSQYNQIVKTFFSTSPLELVWIRIESLFYLLSPYQLIVTEGSQSILTRLWALGLYSIPGAVGVGLFVPLVGSLRKYLFDKWLWVLWLMPIIFSVIVIGWPRGLGALHFAEAAVVILTACSVAWLQNTSRSRKWIYPAFALNVLQLVYLFAYTYDFNTSINSPKQILAAIASLCVVGLCSYSLYCIVSNNRFAKLLLDTKK